MGYKGYDDLFSEILGYGNTDISGYEVVTHTDVEL